MKIAVAVSTRNRPQWVRLFLLQMANQTVRPDVVVIHENGQDRSMKTLYADIPIKTEIVFSPETFVSPDYPIPTLRRALELNPDVVLQLNDDNVYFSDHIEKVLEGLKGGADVSYLSHGNLLAISPSSIYYYEDIEWSKHFGNLGVDDGFAMTVRAAKQYLTYLEYASKRTKEPSWRTGEADCPSNHYSDGVRFAYKLHPEKPEYNFLRRVNFVRTGTMAWVHHGENFSTVNNQGVIRALINNLNDWSSRKLHLEGRV